jgi:hypothetical protein
MTTQKYKCQYQDENLKPMWDAKEIEANSAEEAYKLFLEMVEKKNYPVLVKSGFAEARRFEEHVIPVTKMEETGNPGESEPNDEGKHSRDYPALRILAKIFWALAIIQGIASWIAVFVCLQKQDVTGLIYSILAGTLGVVLLIATAEGIRLFINIAEDVRELKTSCKQ